MWQAAAAASVAADAEAVSSLHISSFIANHPVMLQVSTDIPVSILFNIKFAVIIKLSSWFT